VGTERYRRKALSTGGGEAAFIFASPNDRHAMLRIQGLPLLFTLLATAVSAQPDDPVVLVVHGGAGTIRQSDMTPETEAAIRAALEEALQAGHAAIQDGRPALDAVVAAVEILEDDPNFNAGRGGVFAADYTVRHDASIMDGATGQAGATANTMHVRHPIRLARAVMEHSPHVLLTGEGAEEFAMTQGLELVPNEWFHTDRRREALEAVQRQEREQRGDAGSPEPEPWQMHGTVGAVARDREGRLAAGTSTGGMTNKKWGRVGDSPIIGAGTYADGACGVSSTGWGEFFIRLAVAHDIAARVRYLGETCAYAARHVIHETLTEAGGTGGVIVLDPGGNVAMPFNTEGMYRGYITESGAVTVRFYGEE
jgi:L-asparaginase / beta-aspartyl-peptidase